MKLKTLALITLAIAAAVATFTIGYLVGNRAGRRGLVAFQLKTDLILYHAAERGDLASLKESLGTVLVAKTRTYEALFPRERSSKTLLEAQQISREIESKAGPRTEMPLSAPNK